MIFTDWRVSVGAVKGPAASRLAANTKVSTALAAGWKANKLRKTVFTTFPENRKQSASRSLGKRPESKANLLSQRDLSRRGG
jgi:hypothetical protein